MSAHQRRYLDEVPEAVEDRLRRICMSLPEVTEERAWVGTRWTIRRRTFAHVLTIEFDGDVPLLMLVFRADGEDLEALQQIGRPFVALGWGRNAIGVILDERTDWDDVAELVIESFCLMAPKKLAQRLERD